MCAPVFTDKFGQRLERTGTTYELTTGAAASCCARFFYISLSLFFLTFSSISDYASTCGFNNSRSSHPENFLQNLNFARHFYWTTDRTMKIIKLINWAKRSPVWNNFCFRWNLIFSSVFQIVANNLTQNVKFYSMQFYFVRVRSWSKGEKSQISFVFFSPISFASILNKKQRELCSRILNK